MATRKLAWAVLTLALLLGNAAQGATFPADVPTDGAIITDYAPIISAETYDRNLSVNAGGHLSVGENGSVTGDSGKSLAIDGGRLDIISTKVGAASWTTTAAGFDMTGGTVSIVNSGSQATLDIDGGASVSGGGVTVTDGEFKANWHSVSGSGVIALRGGFLEATAATSGGLGVDIRDGGTLQGAGQVFGATNTVFSLSKGTLEMTGRIPLQGFDGTGHTSLDGALVFNGLATGDAFSGFDNGIFDARYSDIVMGGKTTIAIEGGLAQAIAAKAAAGAFDGTDANSVLLVTGMAGADYSAYLTGGPQTVSTALGQYTVATGDTVGGLATELKITNATNVVDFTTSDSQNGSAAFKKNMDSYVPRYAKSGFLHQIFGAAIGQSGLDLASEMHGDYNGDNDRFRPIFSDSSGAGDYNYNVLKAYLNGKGASWNDNLYTGNTASNHGAAGHKVLEMAMGQTLNAVHMVSVGNNALTGIMNNLNTLHPQTENRIANSAFLPPPKTGDAYASLAPRNDPANGIWANAIGLWEDADSRRGLDGYKLDTQGVMLGYGRMLGQFVLGASAGYLGSDYKDKAMDWNDSDLGSYSINLYASYRHCSGFFGTVVGGYAYTDYDMRYGAAADSYAEDFHADSWYAQGRLGYSFLPMANFSVVPSVGIGYARTETSAHDLRLQGVGNIISYSRHKTGGAFLPVALDLTYAAPLCGGGVLLLTGSGGYTYNFNTDGARGTMLLNNLINSSAYAISGRGGSRYAWNVGGGAKYVAERWEAGARYDYQKERASDTHSVQAHVSFKF